MHFFARWFEKTLKTSKEYLFILESIIADKNIMYSWNIITDFKKLSNLCKKIGTNFAYQNIQYKVKIMTMIF